MASTYVVNNADTREIGFPVSGAGANIPIGTLLMRGATAGTNKGVLIPATAGSNAHGLGILVGPHIYGSSGDALTATLTQWFPIPSFEGNSSYLNVVSAGSPLPSHPVNLFDTMTAIKVDYDLTTAIAVVSNTTTTVVVTSFEDGYDGGFLYVNAGAGIGQLEFVQASSSGNITIPVTPTVALTSTSKLTKIQPLFLDTIVWTINTATVPTQIGGTAAAGTGRAVNLANFISKNGLSTRLDPKIYNNAQSLNTVTALNFYSYLGAVDTAFHPVA